MVQETKNLTRNSFIDIVSGLFVVEIIIEHLLQNAEIAEGSFYSDYVVRFFSAFMPWFYFKAGMMFKEVYWKDGILKRVKKLFYPFITWSVVGSLLIFPLALINSDIIWWGKKILSAFFYGQGAHNVPLWFLLSLFFVYIIVYIRVIKVSWTHIIILGVLSWLFNLIPYKLPMGLSNLTLGAFFFVLGAKFNSLKISHPKYWVAVLSGVYVSLVSLYYSQFNFRWNRLQDGGSLDGGGYFMYLLETGIFLFVLWLIIQNTTLRFKPAEYLGRKSMVLYVSHMPVISAITYLNKNVCCFADSGRELFIYTGIAVFLTTCLLLLGDKKLGWLYQKR